MIKGKGKVMSKLLLFLSLLFFLAGCEQLNNVGEINNSQKYPAKVGNEWEYNTTWKLEFYDSTGNIDSTSFENLGNSIVRVVKEKDTIEIFTNLIRFEYYNVVSPQDINKMWYENNASGLSAIAYSNPGVSQWVVPKRSFSSHEQFRNMIKTIGLLPGGFGNYFPTNSSLDSIHFYLPFRKVLIYPLTIGARWIELTQPFFRERFIEKQQIINTNGMNYNCYKIESNMSWENFEFNDYVDFNTGLIKREVIADSLMVTTAINPDSGTLVKSTTISKLVRTSKY